MFVLQTNQNFNESKVAYLWARTLCDIITPLLYFHLPMPPLKFFSRSKLPRPPDENSGRPMIFLRTYKSLNLIPLSLRCSNLIIVSGGLNILVSNLNFIQRFAPSSPTARSQEGREGSGGCLLPSPLLFLLPAEAAGTGDASRFTAAGGRTAGARQLLLDGMAWNSLAWQGSRAGTSSCGCLCGSLEGPSPPCAPGSALAPPHGRPCLTWLWDGSLPSGPTLWAKETLPVFSPLCWREE